MRGAIAVVWGLLGVNMIPPHMHTHHAHPPPPTHPPRRARPPSTPTLHKLAREISHLLSPPGDAQMGRLAPCCTVHSARPTRAWPLLPVSVYTCHRLLSRNDMLCCVVAGVCRTRLRRGVLGLHASAGAC